MGIDRLGDDAPTRERHEPDERGVCCDRHGDLRASGASIAGYGAAAKGNTLLNYCGIGPELLSFTVDHSPHKQGQYLPGTRIPIYPPDAIEQAQPDYVLILPWNLKDEITEQMKVIRNWGGRFVVAIPSLEVLA